MQERQEDILTCRTKQDAALFFQGEGNYEEQSDTGLRSWYHYNHVAVPAVLHCHYIQNQWRHDERESEFIFSSLLLLHSFCPFICCCHCFWFCFLLKNRKELSKKTLNTWWPSCEWIFKMQRKQILLSLCNSISFSVIIPV